MNPIIQKRYDKAGPRVAAALSRRNMEAFYCPTAIEGAQKVLELIAPEDVVSWGGAMTADEVHEDVEIGMAAIERRRPDLEGRNSPNKTDIIK